MNLRRWMKQSRLEIGQTTVAIFGPRMDNREYQWGTGLLVDFRGTPIILTCEHVVGPLEEGETWVTTGRYTHQTRTVHRRIFSDKTLDVAALVLDRPEEFARKRFIPAGDICLEKVAAGECVFAHGFPVGHKAIQVGGQLNIGAARAHFRSLTYFTLTMVSCENSRLGRPQPRLQWNRRGNHDAKHFRLLPRDLTSKQRGGISGGPVLLANSLRVIGMITDASDWSLFYTPSYETLRWVETVL